MAEAIANVQNRLSIEGVETVSDAAKKAQGALDGLGKTSGKMGDAIGGAAAKHGEGVKKIQETSGDLESALKGVKDFAPGVADQMSGLGDAFGATEGVMRLLPGPAGLAAAAIVGIGLAAYTINKNLNETAAKLKDLANLDAKGLKDDLNLSTDAAIKLSQALQDLPVTLRPTESLLKLVRDRAESLGKDGEVAVEKLTLALAKGPAEVERFEREFGKLSKTTSSLPDVANRLGLSTTALGLEKIGTLQEQIKAAAEKAVVLEREKQGLLQGAADLEAQSEGASSRKAASLIAQADTLRAQANSFQELVDSAVKEAGALERTLGLQAHQLELQKQISTAAANRASQASLAAAGIAVAEADANNLLDKRGKISDQLFVIQLKTRELTRKTNELEAARLVGLVSEVDYRKEILGLKQEAAGITGSEIALGKQATADLKERRDKGRAAHEGEMAAQLRLTKANIESALTSINTLGTVHALRLSALAQEERAEIEKDAHTANTKKGHEASKTEIHKVFAAKRLAVSQDEINEEKKLSDENIKELEESSARGLALAKSSGDAIASVKKATSTSLAASLRAQGADERADLIERAQAQADYAAQVNAAETERLALIKDKLAPGFTDYANVVAQADAKKAQAALMLEGIEKKIDDAASDRQRNRRSRAVDSLEGPAKALQSLAALGKGFESAGALGTGLTAGIKGFKDLDAAMSKSAVKASEVTGAIGDAAAGIAGGVIDADTKRTVSALDNDEQRALSTATSEAERAEITRKYEDAKAKAVEDAERKKALIMALVEGAKALASYPNIPEMVAHGAAAIAFAAIAGGAGGSAAPSTSGLYGGLNSPTSGGSGGNSGGGQGSTTIINFNQPLVTKQEIGKAVHGALRSLKGTGTDGTKGA